MLDGHFDYGNGFHGRVYLNPHRIFRQPSLIWRLAQDLIEVLPDPIVAEPTSWPGRSWAARCSRTPSRVCSTAGGA